MKGKLGHMVQIRVNVMLLTSLLMDLCGGGGGGGGGGIEENFLSGTS